MTVEPRPYLQRIYPVFSLVLFAGLLAYRFSLFSDIEPRSDQAFFSWWVQGLAQTDHVFPTIAPDESFLASLERDDESFLHRLLRPIHGKSVAIFTVVPLALRLMAAWIFGDGYGVQVASSIFAATLIVPAIGFFPVWVFRSGQNHANAMLAAIFTGSAFYLHYFSPWGNHNIGVLFLILAAVATERAIHFLENKQDGAAKVVLLVALLQVLALYAHWTNVFLVPAATFLAWAFTSVSMRRKITIAGYYLGALLIAALPFFLFAANDLSRPNINQNHTVWVLISIAFDRGLFEFVQAAGDRAVQWFYNIATIFSVSGVFLGLLGVALLAVRQRILFPLALCVTHFLISITVAIFIGAHFRTSLYVLPFLALGLAYLIALSLSTTRNFLQHRKSPALALAGMLMIALASHHLWQQVTKTGVAALIRKQNPVFWATYFQGQGEVGPVAKEIDEALPNRAVVITWGYGMQFLLRNYGIERSGRTIAPTLLTLLPRIDNGDLTNLIKHRNLSIPAGEPIYALIDHAADRVDRENVRRGIENTLGPAGFAIATEVNLAPIGRWPFDSSWPRDVALYRVRLN